MNTAKLMQLAAIGVLALGMVATAPATAEEELLTGSYWYVIDNIDSVQENAVVEFYTALPYDNEDASGEVTSLTPEPLAILEDAEQGNRVALWRVEVDAGQSHILFNYTFAVTNHHHSHDLSNGEVAPYDRQSDLYRRYTKSETLIETDEEILAQAQEIVGDELDPRRQAKLIFGWLVGNVEFVVSGNENLNSHSTLARRRGNCGHISLLFCSFCRAIGIPARTVNSEWRDGGSHRHAEFYVEGAGWIPVDPSVAQVMVTPESCFSYEEMEEFLELRGIPSGDPSWLFGNVVNGCLALTRGNDIVLPGAEGVPSRTFAYLYPGGRNASPEAIHIEGLNSDIVHGGFFVFDRHDMDDAAVLELAYQKLANSYFAVGQYEQVEASCLKAVETDPEGALAWLNLGKVYLHKGLYHRAEATFRRSLKIAVRQQRTKHEVLAWAHNYLGNCYDLLGQRDMALKEYGEVLAQGIDFQGAVEYARRYVAEPFSQD